MTSHHGYFGGKMLVQMETRNGQIEETWLDRDLWFDQDIDGRWLVGVNGEDPTDESMMGAVIVRDEAIGHFIETLGRLIANPAEFAGDPVLVPLE